MPRKNLIWAAAVIAVALITAWVAHSPPDQRRNDRSAPAPLEKCWDLVKHNYYRPLDDTEMTRAALRGLSSLDEYSTYIPPGLAQPVQDRVMGSRHALGLCVEIHAGAVMVIGPIAGSPAHRAGLFEGDRLLAIDERDVGGMTLEQVETALGGPRGSTVRLTVLPVDGRQRVLDLQRSDVVVETVVGLFRDRGGQWVHLLDDKGVAYVRIKEFTPDTVGALDRVMRQPGAPEGLVLDLRDNPGGLLTAAVGVASRFVRQGMIVTKVSRAQGTVRYEAHPDGGAYPQAMPVVVLVNDSTASAAEIVAGALRLHRRAVVVGSRTMGKGFLQSLYDLGNGLGRLSLTTAEYFVGDDVAISRRPGAANWGVEPDVQASLLPGKALTLGRLRVQGEVMPRPAPATMPGGEANATTAATFLALDTQLAQALALLKDPREMRLLLKPPSGSDARGSAPASGAGDE